MPEETNAAPLAPILTPGAREEEVEEEEEGEKEGEKAREKLLGRVGRSGCPAPEAMTVLSSRRRRKRELNEPKERIVPERMKERKRGPFVFWAKHDIARNTLFKNQNRNFFWFLDELL